MKVSTEKLANSEVVLTVESDAATLDAGIKKAYTRLANRVNIPGFRKGKTPPKILERHLGKAYIVEEAFNIIYPQLVADAIKETEMHPVTVPTLNIISLEEGKDFSFKLTFTNMPEVTLGKYKGLEVPMPAVNVTDEDVEKQLLVFQKRRGKMLDAPDGATVENGDFITLDFEGFVDGEAFEGGKSKDYPLEIGSGSFIPGFEEQLIGLGVDQEKDVNVTFPENYHSADLAGKPALFKCTVHSIRRQELAPLDDELAKAVSKFETLEELRADLRKNLETAAKNRATAERNNTAIQQALDNTTVDIPPIMIANHVDNMIKNLEERVKQQGMDFDSYLEYTNTDLTKVREEYKEQAAHDVKLGLMLIKIAETEKIELTEEETKEALEKMALRFNTTAKQIAKTLKEADKYDDFLAGRRDEKTLKVITDSVVEG